MERLTAYLSEHGFVYALIAAYGVLLVRHALQGREKTRSASDYFVGGRAMGPVVIGLSFFATYSSTNSFVGFSGQAYEWGVTWFLLVPFVAGLSACAWIFVAPRLRTFTESMGSLTIPDFIGFRFQSQPARILAAAIVLFASFIYMTAVFKGIGILLEAFLDIPYGWAIGIVFVVVMLYTVSGGFISVVKTDALQGALMIVAGVLLFQGVVAASGGLASFQALGGDPTTRPLLEWGGGVSVPFALGVVFAGTVKFLVEPRQLSRFYALESRAAVRKGVWISTGAFLLVYSLLVPVGLYARNVLGSSVSSTDLVVPELLATTGVFHPWVAAFLLLAMAAAAMSSLDSVLLVMAASAERDIVHPVFFKGRTRRTGSLRVTRSYVAVFALVTAIISLNPPAGIVSLTAFSGAVFGACFGPSIILGLYWRKGNGIAAIASFLAGLAVLAFWSQLAISQHLHQVFPAVLLSFSVYVIAALLASGPESSEVRRLFKEEEAR